MLRQRRRNDGTVYQLIMASAPGKPTAGGLARLPRALALHHPRVVILELGGNDGLRALPIDQMRGNLAKMVDLSADSGAQVLLLGMRIPPNYGPEFTEKFFAVFAEVARDKR